MPYTKKQQGKLIIVQPLGDSPETVIAWVHVISFNQRTGIVSKAAIYAPSISEQQGSEDGKRFIRYIDLDYLQAIILGHSQLRYITRVSTVIEKISVQEMAAVLIEEIFNADVQAEFDIFVFHAAHRWKLLLSFASEFLSTGLKNEDDFHPWDVHSYIQRNIPGMESLADVYGIVSLIAQQSMPKDGASLGLLPNPNQVVISPGVDE